MLASLGEQINDLERDVYDDGYLRVEHNLYYVNCGGELVRLPRLEFLLLSRLVRSADRIVELQELWKYAWRTEKPLNADSLHVYMYRLRCQLAPYGIRIENMVHIGYRVLTEERERVVDICSRERLPIGRRF